ncbi:probable fucosyltransferase 8 [Gastrolobium bilobum]|uniref:probable fucosyltransferase 8 n=1 Tax=Gastrolobium bilobum TaxID=150636 RepID=UPI002AB22013|nr:probable fucosyltransferase 8 [Gastrolobium bilobum]
MEWLELSSKKIKASLVIIAIGFSLLILTFTSNFGHLKGFSIGEVLSERSPNVTTNGSVLGTKNFTGSRDSSSLTRNHADKFIDGLLTSGFDEGSCLSRFQSYLYSKASPHKPSPYLISKLRNYEVLHKKCGPHTRSYKRTMVMLKRFRTNVTAKFNYIVWTPANGLGNRMVSMAASFLYALLTDRVLLVEFQNDMVGLFCEPFPNSSWILPKDFPFTKNQGHFETYQSMLKKDMQNHSKEILPSVLHLNIQHSKDDPERFFCCDHSQHLLQKVPLLIFVSDQYFVPCLFMVPSFSQELNKMFPEKDTVFHHLGRYLFLPSNEVWGPISRFYQAYLVNADERIGLQIRVFNPDLTPYQTIMNQVLNCTLNHKILPDFTTEGSKVSPWKNQTLKSVLVASLYPKYGENLRNMYLTRPTVTGEIIGVYQPSHEGQQKFHDNMHNMKAWTEIYLLSLCDVLVTSSLSTFGYVAQSLGGLKPWVLYKLQDKNIPDPSCVRDFSMEPCFHVPPKIDCMQKPIENIGTLFPYIRRCMDYGLGVKLVNDHQ